MVGRKLARSSPKLTDTCERGAWLPGTATPGSLHFGLSRAPDGPRGVPAEYSSASCRPGAAPLCLRESPPTTGVKTRSQRSMRAVRKSLNSSISKADPHFISWSRRPPLSGLPPEHREGGNLAQAPGRGRGRQGELMSVPLPSGPLEANSVYFQIFTKFFPEELTLLIIKLLENV